MPSSPLKWPCPNSCNLETCCVIWQGRLKVADESKVTNQLTLTLGDYLDYPGGSTIITEVWMSEGRRQEAQSQGSYVMMEAEVGVTGLALNVEGAMSQGMWAAPRIWEWKGNGFPFRSFWKEWSPTDTLNLAQWESYWPSDYTLRFGAALSH